MFNSDIRNLRQLMERFPTEQSCIEYLEELLWNGTPVSPFAPGSKVWTMKNGRYKCSKTRKYFNVLKGTMYENTKIPLRDWFIATWLLINEKKGVASYRVVDHLNVTQKTGWFMLQRIRKCLGIENRAQLDGIVEVDEALVGGKNKNRHMKKRMKGTGGRSAVDRMRFLE